MEFIVGNKNCVLRSHLVPLKLRYDLSLSFVLKDPLLYSHCTTLDSAVVIEACCCSTRSHVSATLTAHLFPTISVDDASKV
jgi:hypothetical protein